MSPILVWDATGVHFAGNDLQRLAIEEKLLASRTTESKTVRHLGLLLCRRRVGAQASGCDKEKHPLGTPAQHGCVSWNGRLLYTVSLGPQPAEDSPTCNILAVGYDQLVASIRPGRRTRQGPSAVWLLGAFPAPNRGLQ
jgi:hypothetical protein